MINCDMNIIFQFENNKMQFLKNIIFLLFVQSCIGQLDKNLLFDDKGNFFDPNIGARNNRGAPVNFLKLVASKVKGQEKVEKIEEPIKESLESIQDAVGYLTYFNCLV